MKVYLIYEQISSIPYLFGYTKNKEDIDQFRIERNMTYYTIIKKSVSEKELKEKKIPVLKQRGLKTFNRDTWMEENVYLELTDKEEFEVCISKTDYILKELGKYTEESVKVLNTEMINALNDLGYFDLYRIRLFNEGVIEDSFVNTQGYGNIHFKLDELSVFIKLYGFKMDDKHKMKMRKEREQWRQQEEW